jgi:hypothetical protein
MQGVLHVDVELVADLLRADVSKHCTIARRVARLEAGFLSDA